MINQLARYFPIVQDLRANAYDSICEIGSGSYGIGKFFDIAFTGCDSDFEDYSGQKHVSKNPLMTQVQCMAQALPFANGSFEYVFSLDMFEHLSPVDRILAFQEMYRVAEKKIVIGFPCGPQARKIDALLEKYYRKIRKKEPPGWLSEHLANEYPDKELEKYLNKHHFAFKKTPNENIYLHFITIVLEGIPGGSGISNFLSSKQRFTSFLLGWLFQSKNAYRQIYTISKT